MSIIEHGSLAEAVCPEERTWHWNIAPEDDDDGFQAADHRAVTLGMVKHLNWSRFGSFTPEHFRKFVDMGFPARKSWTGLPCNWSPEAIDKEYQERNPQ